MPVTEHWKEQVDARLDALEKKQAAMDAVIASARWLTPLVVGLAGVLIGKFACAAPTSPLSSARW